MTGTLIAISMMLIVLAFNCGPSFVGMFLGIASIGCLGLGLGNIMNSSGQKDADKDQ